MFFLFVAQQGEGRTKLGVEFVRTVAHDWQAAALGWPIFCEGGDYHMPTGLDRTKNGLNVGMTILLRCEEVEYRAVMPDIVGVDGQRCVDDVCLDLTHCA